MQCGRIMFQLNLSTHDEMSFFQFFFIDLL